MNELFSPAGLASQVLYYGFSYFVLPRQVSIYVSCGLLLDLDLIAAGTARRSSSISCLTNVREIPLYFRHLTDIYKGIF